MLPRDLLAKAGRKPAGVARIVMLDTVVDYVFKGVFLAVSFPLLENNCFVLHRPGISETDRVAIRKAIATEAVARGILTIGGDH